MKTYEITRQLASEFEKNIRGDSKFDWVSRYLYSTDASAYQLMPAGVIIPLDTQDARTAIEICRKHQIPVTPRGGGTSLSGQAIGNGIVIDFSSHFDHILEINADEQWVNVESGIVLDRMNTALKPYGLTLGPDPSSSASATLGGIIANNATGSHSIRYGMMVDHVNSVEAILADGSIVEFSPKTQEEVRQLSQKKTLEGSLYREIPALLSRYAQDIESNYPKTWRNVAGYNLNRLLEEQKAGKPFNLAPLIVGSEGTLCNVLSARINLVKLPSKSRLMILHFDSLQESLESVPMLLENKPAAVELINRFVMNITRNHPKYGPLQNSFVSGDPEIILIVEFYGENDDDVAAQAADLEKHLQHNHYQGDIVHCITEDEMDAVWTVRKAGLGLLQSKRGEAKPINFMDDISVPIEELVSYATEIEKVCLEEGSDASFTAHASAGCLHIEPELNLKTEEGVQKLRRMSEAFAEITIAHHGTTSGEHGEGLARGYYNEKLFGKRLHQAFLEVKKLFDADNLMNPGKIFDSPEPWDTTVMRYSPSYAVPQMPENTYYDFSADGGFNGLVEMCNGDAVCRRLDIGIMCPSYRVTRQEMHSTRGRANALRAAMTGQLGPDGMTGKELYQVFDLCLSCKACKKECPSLVDMAKLKSEFLAHYQEKHGVPVRSLMFGHVGFLNRLGSTLPPLTNWGYQNPLVRRALDRIIGVDERRELPPVAGQTFQQWFNNHQKPTNSQRGIVILWDDCFTSYNTPEIGQAAVKLLEAAGFEVRLLEDRRCCGRPMFSKGLLKEVKRNAEHNVALLAPYARQGIPIVGVEPSCITSFRDEYLDLVRTDAAQQVASGSYFIEEFITQLAERGELSVEFSIPQEPQHILLHGQCYQKTTIGTEPVKKMLRLLPETTVEEIPSGCCGMAGSFGFEKEHYEISMRIGEETLFPAVRGAAKGTIIAAEGTSCRGQIKDGTGVTAIHPVIILADRIKK